MEVAVLCCEIRDWSWVGSLDDVAGSRLQQIVCRIADKAARPDFVHSVRGRIRQQRTSLISSVKPERVGDVFASLRTSVAAKRRTKEPQSF
jgi:hypothetical protein